MLIGGEDRSSLKEHHEHRPDGPKSERPTSSQSRRERVANLATQRRRGWKHAIAKLVKVGRESDLDVRVRPRREAVTGGRAFMSGAA